MLPEDRVLVGVINRKRDLVVARDRHWYRIPQTRMPHGVYAEHIAFFLSGKVFKEQSGGIHYYALRQGVELVYRRDLFPGEADHPRANNVYYKVQLGELIGKVPPVLNLTKRPISFIYTTWDRFIHAQQISDLYSKADYFVDRVYHALRDTGVRPQRFWEAQYPDTGHGARLRILCENGSVTASPLVEDIDLEGVIFLDEDKEDDAILQSILAAIAKHGGPVTINIPIESEW